MITSKERRVKLRSVADAMMRPAVPVARALSRRRVAVLAYHDVPPGSLFADHLDHLGRHFEPVSADDLLAASTGGGLPANAVLITFDDGDPTVLQQAAPLLQQRGIPAVAFVVAGFVDTDLAPWWVETAELPTVGAQTPDQLIRRMKQVPDQERLDLLSALRTAADRPVSRRQLSSGECRELEAMGVSVGNHSMTHPLLDRCDGAKVRTEIMGAHERLRDILGHAPSTIAYPNGNVDDRSVAAAARCGYRLGFLFDHRLAGWPPPNPLRVSRLRVNASDDLHRFAAVTSGLHPAIHHRLGRP